MQQKLKVNTNAQIIAMPKKELIKNIASVLIVLRDKNKLSNKTMEYLRIFLYEIQRSKEYIEYITSTAPLLERKKKKKPVNVIDFNKYIKTLLKGVD